ncbi:MAG: winged helix-turn-helix transcriptional regulator [Roseitalea porphyridii]
MAITLGLLNAVEREEQVTQRSLAGELGIALGLANAYLKRAAHKGLIKVRQVPPNRYAYYLTPQGFKEKARLTGEYLSSSFTFFRRAKDEIAAELQDALNSGRRRVVLIGLSELTEIAALCQLQIEMELVGIVDAKSGKDSYAGLPVARRIEDLPAAEAYLITDLKNAQQSYEEMVRRYGPDRVYAPKLLHVRLPQTEPADEREEIAK